MVGSIEPIENGAYRIRHLKVDAEVGDTSVPGFKPKLKLKRWGGECFLDINFASVTTEEEAEEETDGEGKVTKVKWKIKTGVDELELEYCAKDRACLESIAIGVCNDCGRCCGEYFFGEPGETCKYFDPDEPLFCSRHVDRRGQLWRDDETKEEWLARKNPDCPYGFRLTLGHLWNRDIPECGISLSWERVGSVEETLVFDIRQRRHHVDTLHLKSHHWDLVNIPSITQSRKRLIYQVIL